MSESLRQRSRALGAIVGRSLDDVVPGFADLVLESGHIELVEAGTSLAVAGAPIEDLIIPLSASVRVHRSGDGATDRIAQQARLQVVALKELLLGEICSGAVVTDRPTLILTVPGAAFAQHLAKHPTVAAYLVVSETSPAFRALSETLQGAGVPMEAIIALASTVSEPAELAPGSQIDVSGGRLWFVESGLLQAKSGDDGWRVEGGAWFGGESLIPPHRCSYGVSAVTPAVLRSVRLSHILHILEPFDPWSTLFAEPGMKRGLHAPPQPSPAAARAGTVLRWNVGLPGDVVPERELHGLDLPPPGRLRRAESDEACVAASAISLATMIDVVVNPAALEEQLEADDIVTVARLAMAIEPYGILVQGLATRIADLHRHPLPGLVHFGSRMCVLLRAERRSVLLYDPVRGVVRVSSADFEDHWDGTLIAATNVGGERASAAQTSKDPEVSTDAEVSRSRRGQIRHTFLRELAPLRGLLANVILLSLALMGLGLLIPRISQGILDEVLTLRDVPTLWSYIAGMGLVIAFSTVLAVSRNLVLSELSYRVDHRFTTRFYRHALSLPMRFFGDQRAGDILSRIHEITRLRQFFSATSLGALMNVVQLLIFAAVLFFYSVKVGLLALALLPVVLLVRLAFAGRLRRAFDDAFRFGARAQSLLGEQISAMATIKSTGAEDSARHRWEDVFVKRVESGRRALVTETTISNLNGLFGRIVEITGTWLAASVALEGKLSPGEIFAITAYLSQAVNAALGIGGVITSIEEMRVAAEKVGRVVLAEQEEPPRRAVKTIVAKPRGKIQLDQVSFRYASDSPWVLRDLSLTIYPRQVVAIVGRSGCGKTTLANLIAANLKPTSGRIFYDEYDSAFLSMASIRRQIGIISQDANLFAGSIADNIAYTDDAPDSERITAAADGAAALEFIQRFPSRFSTQLAVGGLGLSGGQRQRTSIARALYREPQILVMDEATSSLDAASEAAVMSKMQTILADKTAIVIAHRLSTVRSVDRVLVMKNGQIVEDGTHAELMSRGGHYWELFEGQFEAR